MGKIYTIEGNTSGGSKLVANGGGVAKKSYDPNYSKIACIYMPLYRDEEALKVAQEALKYQGYLEKKSNAMLEDFKANAGYNNYTMFADHARKVTGSGVYANGQPWCDSFVDDMMIRALGKNRAKELLMDWSAYTPASASYLKKAGAKEIKDFSKAQFGAIIFFKNSVRICHTGIVVTGIESADGILTQPASTAYNRTQLIKDVCQILGVSDAKSAIAKTVTLSKKKNSKHALVLPLQKYFKALGIYKGTCDREYGTLMADAVREYQREIVRASAKNCDGIITAKAATWKKLLL